MAVAEAFKSASLAHFDGLTIDATALYALSAPDVPQAARDEAVTRAEAGEHITKQEAERGAVRKAFFAQCAEAFFPRDGASFARGRGLRLPAEDAAHRPGRHQSHCVVLLR